MQEVNETTTPAMAPGCYASPSVFASDSDICRGCPVFDDCSQACVETLHALRDRINVDGLLARHREARQSTIEATPRAKPALPVSIKFMPSVKPATTKVEPKQAPKVTVSEVSPEQEAIIATITQVNAQELARKWCKRGIIDTIAQDLRQGRNPFASQARHDHCSVVCDELLKGTVTKQMLKQAFMKRLGNKTPWDERTASAHVNIAMPVLVAFGIAVETPAGFIVNPATGTDNV